MNYEELFKEAKNKKITNMQIVEKTVIDSSVEIIDGKIESYDDYNNIDYVVKAEYKGKTVKLKANYLDNDCLDLIIEKCCETDSEYQDMYLNKTENIPKNTPVEFNIKDEINTLISLNQLKEKYPKIEKITAYFSEQYANTRIINSNGVDISTDTHLCTLVVEAITKNNDNYISYDEKLLTTDKSSIHFEEFAKRVIERTLLLSKQKKIESKKYNIILDSKVASRIIRSFNHTLSATAIRNKVSCMENKLNKKIFSDKLTILEDPTNKEYPGYRLFDNEGTKTYKKEIVKDGIVETYLYDIKESLLANTNSTANGYDGISTRNMYVLPGNKSNEELLQELGNGIYVIDYMESGGTSINSVNGNISLQIFGFIVENGKFVSSIEPSIMTSTIFELLSNIKDIGNDLQFTSTVCASPSLLINEISIAR